MELFTAIKRHDVEQVRMLLEMGIDPCYTIPKSHSEIHQQFIRSMAEFKDEEEEDDELLVGELLVGDMTFIHEDIQYTPLMLIFLEPPSNEGYEMAWLLLDYGVDLNFQNILGETALLLAIENHHQDIILDLIDHGANPNVEDVYGNTALIQAVIANDMNIVHTLIEVDVNVNARNTDGYTALIIAVDDNRVEIMYALLEANANPNIQTNQGNTALIIAVRKNHIDIIKALIDHGADPFLYRIVEEEGVIVNAFNASPDIQFQHWILAYYKEKLTQQLDQVDVIHNLNLADIISSVLMEYSQSDT